MITTEKITTTDVKRFNRNRIFRLIHEAGKISRQEIADVLQLSLPTVNQNLKSLQELNLITFEGNFESTGGRKAQVISVNGLSKCAISVNVSDYGVKVALIDLNGNIICELKKTVLFDGTQNYSNLITSLIQDIILRNSIEKENILGVGITIPGIMDNEQKVILSAPTMGIRNCPVNLITKDINFNYRLMNDARANAYAEFWFNKEDKESIYENFKNREYTNKHHRAYYLMLNTGVGGACIDHEKILIGSHNRYGEFGHMTLHPGGKRCFCGKNGCFESYVSAKVLSTELGISLEEFFSQVNHGSVEHIRILEEYIENLTTGVNNLYVMTDNEIILGGPVARYLIPYKNKIIKQLIDKYSFDTDASYLSFAKCTTDQSDTGAALTFLGDFISEI
jgi:predicted NBD/HSP70 family sugar kinase